MNVAARSEKTCEACERIAIARNYKKIGFFRARAAFLLIYLSILGFVPLLIFAKLMYWHLKLNGAEHVKRFRDFLPSRDSYRYHSKSQIVFDQSSFLLKYSFFWIFNCSYYCPYSVALLDWMAYLAKLVENWWCPFAHGRKTAYASSAIDRSFWHIYPSEAAKLHHDDLTNSLWNTETPERRIP